MKRNLLSIFLAVALVVTSLFYAPAAEEIKADVAGPTGSWKEVWSDNFNGSALDTSAWTYETGNGYSGWGNNEIQYYTDRADNVSVSDGNLKIVAKRENYSGSQFTSGRLKTQGKKAFQYGKMEARIKVEGGNQNAVWPAFWMMGNDGLGWPACGELDIMEHRNSENQIIGTLHWGTDNANHQYMGSETTGNFYNFSNNATNGITAWHTYGVTWDADSIKWYVDNNVYQTINTSQVGNASYFRKAHYFLLNLAIGGPNTPFTGGVQVDSGFQSATMYVDYVKAYEYDPSGAQDDTPSGYTAGVSDSWQNIGAWNYYAGGSSEIAYKTTDSISNLDFYIKNKGSGDWSTQLKSNAVGLEAGATYNYSVTINSTSAFDGFVMNYANGDGGYISTPINGSIAAGNQTFNGQITAQSNSATFFMNLANANTGTTFKITDFQLTKAGGQDPTQATQATTEAPTTTAEATTEEESGEVIVPQPFGLTYAGNDDLPFYFAWAGLPDIDGFNVYVDGELAQFVTGSLANLSEDLFAEGDEHIVAVRAVKGDKVSKATGLMFNKTTKTSTPYEIDDDTPTTKATTTAEPTTTEAPTTTAEPTTTEAPTTTAEPTTQKETEQPTQQSNKDLQIHGFQISTTYEGYRVVASVESTIGGKDVTSWGLIYGLKTNGVELTGIEEDDLLIGSDSAYIKAYASTAAGTLDTKFGESDTATYFARTMTFGKKSKNAFSAVYMVRPYAQLSDGTFAYGDVASFSVYDVADTLYSNVMMNTKDAHDYLYNTILTKVNPQYEQVDYQWDKTIAPPDEI